MALQGKTLYNLLRNNWLQDSTIKVKPWQVEDYRALSVEELFKRLNKMGIPQTEQSFLSYAHSCDAPEELADCLWVDEEDLEGYDQAYLLIFELWRRLCAHRESLSIFCDELDFLIGQYDRDEIEDEEILNKILIELEDILDCSVDAGEVPQAIFKAIAEKCAYDIERFLYDYISDQIDAERDLYASELIDGFYEYIEKKSWFDFLRGRLFALTEPEGAHLLFRRLLEQLEEEKDLDLLFEILSVLAYSGEPKLFKQGALIAINQCLTEENLQELLSLMESFYRGLDNEAKEKEVQALLKARAGKDLQGDVKPSDLSEIKRLSNL